MMIIYQQEIGKLFIQQNDILKCILVLDRDVQCDFNSPFYEENECGWKYSQRILTSLGIGSSKRMVRSKFEAATATPLNYFQRKNTLFGKYRVVESNKYRYIKAIFIT